MKTIIAVLALSLGLAAHAQNAHTEPGPIVDISQDGVDALNALTYAKSSDLNKFIKAGNTTVSASRRNLKPGVTAYAFVRQHCSMGGFVGNRCLGGALLKVTLTEVRKAEMVTIKATSEIVGIRGIQ